MLRCPRWESKRQQLLTSVEAQLHSFSSLTEGIHSAAITDIPCEDCGIDLLNVDCKIGPIHDLTISVDYCIVQCSCLTVCLIIGSLP